MKLEVYHSDPTKGEKNLIQVFVLDADGVAKPTMPGENDWANFVPGYLSPENGKEYLEALHKKLQSSTYLFSNLI